MTVYAVIWVLWGIGAVLVGASYLHAVSSRIGWVGFGIAISATVASWLL